jgi:hypothetical protein
MNRHELRQQQQEQLMEAYERLSAKTPAEVRKNIYKSITYYWLDEKPPEGFTEAIHYGEEYVKNPRLLPSGGLWVHLARAYSQKARWLKDEGGSEEPDTVLRQSVVRAIEHALQLDETWALEFQLLLRSDRSPNGKIGGEKRVKRDLEIFQTDEEIRELIGLPRKRREPETKSSTIVTAGPPVTPSPPPESAPAPPSPVSEIASRQSGAPLDS